MPGIVIDTNVLISAALYPRGVPRRVLDRVERHHDLVLTARTLDELKATIWRTEFDRLISNRERNRFLHRVRAAAIVLRVVGSVAVARDPDDDVFLHLADVAAAHAIVTGDRDLLVLREFAGIPILSPSAFLRRERSIRRGRRERGD